MCLLMADNLSRDIRSKNDTGSSRPPHVSGRIAILSLAHANEWRCVQFIDCG